jgi:hypothetical protein
MWSAPLIPERGAACLVFKRCLLSAAIDPPFGSRPFIEQPFYKQLRAALTDGSIEPSIRNIISRKQ